MLVYSFNLVIVLVFSWLAYYFRHSSKQLNLYGEKKPLIWFALIALLSLTLVSGLRFFVGTDYMMYSILYSDANTFDIGTYWIKDVEIGFVLLCRLCYVFTQTPYLMFFVTSLIINSLIILSLRDNSKIFWLSSFLYIATNAYYSSFNALRQAVAMSIVFSATGFLLKKQMFKYFLCIGVACLFHISAIVMIPAYFIVHRRAWSPLMWILGAADIMIFLNYDRFVPLLFSVIGNTHYASYEQAMLAASNGVNSLRLVAYLAPLLLVFLYRKKLRELPYSDILTNLYFIGILIYIIALKQIYFARIAQYFIIYVILLLPTFVSVFKNRHFRVTITAAIMICYLVFSYTLLPVDSNVLPYQSIFQVPKNWNIFDYISRYYSQ